MELNVQSFEIENWEELQTGLLIAENDEWILVNHIPADYLLDGYCFYNKKFITNRINGKEERFIERVLKLRGDNPDTYQDFKFRDTIGLLKWVQDNFGIFSFQDEDDEALSIGTINRIIHTKLIIDFVDSKGNVEFDYHYEFDINEIRAISFSSNYFEAIRLLWLDENPLKPTP